MDITVQGRAITPSFCFTLLLLISTGGRDANPTSYCCIMKCKHWSIGESNYPKLQSYSTINLNLNITANQCLYERGSCTNLKSCWNHFSNQWWLISAKITLETDSEQLPFPKNKIVGWSEGRQKFLSAAPPSLRLSQRGRRTKGWQLWKAEGKINTKFWRWPLEGIHKTFVPLK